MKRRIPLFTKDVLVAEYHGNRLSQRDIAGKYGVTQTCVKDYMKRYGIQARPHGPTPVTCARITVLRRKGCSWRMISHLTGCSETQVYTALKRAGMLFAGIPTLHRKPPAGAYPDAEPMVG